MGNKPENQILTAREAAKKARVHYESLLDAAKRGEVPHIRLGARVLFPADFLETMRRPAKAKGGEGGGSAAIRRRRLA